MSLKVLSPAGFRQHRSMLAVIVALAVAVVLLAELVVAGPVNPSVKRGNVTFTQQGNDFIITASDGSIINYDAFGILNHESIQFIQPGEAARVMNRITGPDPTLIDGSLSANGIVYIVNPAGVYFSQGAIVNVGGIYAAAGSITDENYIKNVDLFNNLSGMVQNDGTIHADLVHLIGRNVANHGQIVAPRGIVTMLAGNSVLIRRHGERITVKIDGMDLDDAALSGKKLDHPFGVTFDLPGVENTGVIDAPNGDVILGAGDLYSVAIRNTGRIHAGNVIIATTGNGRIEGEFGDRSSS
ncbi:MAG: filamentous hemagglutinin N-terminal domain-containing protein [Planctomycetes bacterium]|nr:filamentous hemagglutinin N-terminal domain-containing protein [Planctomycetota bacterium]